MASRGFWRELKRRHVYRVAAAYAFVGWLLIQVATQVFPVFRLPDWIDQAVVLLILIGFPIALVLAWAFDATPHGIVRIDTEGGADSRAPPHSHRAVITVGLIGVLVAVAAGAVWWHAERGGPAAPVARDKASAPSDGTPSVASAAAGVSAAKLRVIPVPPIAAQPIPAKSIAVLPFENLSEDKGNAYFADGMQDLILTKLAGIGDLKVISRTSTEKYQSHPDDLKIIAQQLGVATILEGSVQKAGNQVLINVQLIDAHSDNHLWAESYTRTLDNIFGVEGEVAQKVADALQARLTHAEQQNVAAIPTQNPAAYDWFLKAEYQANKAFDSQDVADFKLAEANYRQAIALDPGFALAYARLAYSQLVRHWFVAPLSPEELMKVKATIDHAFALVPDLPEAHLALGYYYYWGYRRYADASAQFEQVLQLAPNNVEALGGLAFIDRRRGRWPQALATLQQALLISPRDAYLLGQHGWTLCIVRRYQEAERLLSRALAIEPGKTDNQDGLWRTRLIGFGDAPGARKANDPLPGWRLDTHKNIAAGEIVALINPIVYPDVFERNFDAALRAWDSAPVNTDAEQLTRRAARVAIEVVAGRQSAIQSECAQLRPPLEAALAKHPDAIPNLQQVAWVDVCLGRNADAIAAARRMPEELPLSTDAFFGAYPLAGLAEVEVHAGAKDQALQLIDQLLAMPAGEVMSVTRLKLDPVWDPLRGDPRFQALLKKYENARPALAGSGGAP
ncbi:MAG: tetratricopeptide repeat protein [Rhodanobacteraceae bacterium]|nr:MAG: tetratricopeptide repeat protein [Rhodanobacteraceae bacterium]